MHVHQSKFQLITKQTTIHQNRLDNQTDFIMHETRFDNETERTTIH